MKKSLAIGIGISIIITIIIIGVYTNQESDIDNKKENNSENYDTGNPEVDERLKNIAKKANSTDFTPAPREWVTSGPFQIDRSKYHLGEKIFLRIGELYPGDKGQVVFLRQTNQTHYTVYQTIPFDGKEKPAFNYYTDIKLQVPLQLCTVDDILGEWTVVFQGTDYPNIKFEIINEFIPGEEYAFEPVC